MTQHRVRIRDIAEELGLSTATVSNVIHGKTGKVSDETVKRVQALLEERQYIPSMAGILLAQNSAKIVCVLPFHWWYFAEEVGCRVWSRRLTKKRKEI